MLLDPETTTTNWTTAHLGLASGAQIGGNLIEGHEVHFMPLVVSRAQAYYWSQVWQRGEATALNEIASGETMRFDDPMDALRWLLEVDEDELGDG